MENNVGKGENAGYQTWPTKAPCVVYSNKRADPFPKQALVFMCLHYNSFENTVGKG